MSICVHRLSRTASLTLKIRFGWTAYQHDALSNCITVSDAAESAGISTNNSGRYLRTILYGIPDEYYGYAFRILQWLAFCLRPISAQEVAEILAIDEETHTGFDPENRLPNPRDILTIFSSLITTAKAKIYPWEEVGELRLAHYSVKEYLILERLSHGLASRYKITVTPDQCIAQTCLYYLLYFCEPQQLEGYYLKRFPLLDYGARNWTTHARYVEAYTDEVSRMSMRLLRSDSQVLLTG